MLRTYSSSDFPDLSLGKEYELLTDEQVIAQLERSADGKRITVSRHDLDSSAVGLILELQERVEDLEALTGTRKPKRKASDRVRRAISRVTADTRAEEFAQFATALYEMPDTRPE